MLHYLDLEPPIKPGVVLREALRERAWSAKELGLVIGKPTGYVRSLLTGLVSIGPETSVDLGIALDLPYDFFGLLDIRYRTFKDKRQSRFDAITRLRKLFEWVPVAELLRQRWIEHARSLEDLEKNVLEFMGAKEIGEFPHLIANYEGSPLKIYERSVTNIWLKRLEWEARHQTLLNPYTKEHILIHQQDLLVLLGKIAKADDVREIVQLMGIRFVILPTLANVRIDGAVGTVKGLGPVIGMTLRENQLGPFWSLLIRLLAHLYLEHDGHVVIYGLPEIENQKELEKATELMHSWFLPDIQLNDLVRKYGVNPTKKELQEHAHSLGIHYNIFAEKLRLLHVADVPSRRVKLRYANTDHPRSSIAALSKRLYQRPRSEGNLT